MRFLLLLTLLSTPVWAQTNGENSKKKLEAERLRDVGAGEWERGDYLPALDHFREAYAQFPSPQLTVQHCPGAHRSGARCRGDRSVRNLFA